MKPSKKSSLRLVSFDNGGPRSLSQLEILGRIIFRLKLQLYPNNPDKILLPCEFVDMMAGTGTGGLLVAMFTILRMSVEEATDAFKIICQKVYRNEPISPKERTLRLRICLEVLLESRGLPPDLKLTDDISKIKTSLLSKDGSGYEKNKHYEADVSFSPEKQAHLDSGRECVGCIIAVDKSDPINPFIFRTYSTHQFEPATLVEVILATCASTPAFSPIIIGGTAREQEFINGRPGVNNPSYYLLMEAQRYYGPTGRVGGFISLGSGKRDISIIQTAGSVANGAIASLNNWWNGGASQQSQPSSMTRKIDEKRYNPTKGILHTNNDLQDFEETTKDAEKTAQEMSVVTGQHQMYIRLCTPYRLQGQDESKIGDISWIVSQTRAYLENTGIYRIIFRCVESLLEWGGWASFDDLNRARTIFLTHRGLPAPERDFMTRPESWEMRVPGMNMDIGPTPGRILVFCGPAGVGKTQSVINFVKKYDSRLRHVLVIDGRTERTIRRSIIDRVCAVSSFLQPTTFEEAMKFFINPTNGPWLLIYQNVDVNFDLQSLLPDFRHGSVIMTTIHRSLKHYASHGSLYFELDVLSESDATKAIVHRATLQPSDASTALLVAKELGRLPIAVILAASFLRETSIPIAAYLEKVRASNYKEKSEDTPPNPLYSGLHAACEMTYQYLPLRVQNFLHILCSLHFADFPLIIIPLAAKSQFRRNNSAVSELDEEAIKLLVDTFSSEGEWSDIAFTKMITCLQAYSLASTSSSPLSRLLSIHPLIHEFINEKLNLEQTTLFQSASIRLIACASQEYELCPFLTPHIDVLPINSPDIPLTASDRGACAEVLIIASRYDEAKVIWKNIYELTKGRYGPDSPEVATAALRLGNTYRDDRSEMENLEKEAARIYEAVLGVSHDKIYEAKLNLANTYHDQHRHMDAIELQESVLYELQQYPDPDHEQLLRTTRALAHSYYHMGRYDEARQLYANSLEQQQKKLGSDHPDTLWLSHQMAGVCLANGMNEDAQRLETSAFHGLVKKLGYGHPSTVAVMRNLATAEHRLGRYEDAQNLQENVLEILKKGMGEGDLQTLSAMYEVGRTYQSQRRFPEAEQLQERVLRERREILGEDHHDTSMARTALATIYHSQRRFTAAQPLFEKSLQINQQNYGLNNQNTVTALLNLAILYRDLGQVSKARDLAIQAKSGLDAITSMEGKPLSTSLKHLSDLAQKLSSTTPSSKTLDQSRMMA